MTGQHHEESDAQRIERDQSPTWFLRLGMAIVGILLVVGAIVATQMHLMVGGVYGQILPWVIMLAVLLGAGAVIESIKTSVWLTLLAGVAAMVTAYLIAGSYVVNLDASAHGVFVVNRYTGETHYCDQDSCQTITEGVTLKRVVKRIESVHH
jgi:hypothetical protein